MGDVLGKGSFGAVYRGINTETGEFVAIKYMEVTKIEEAKVIASEIFRFLGPTDCNETNGFTAGDAQERDQQAQESRPSQPRALPGCVFDQAVDQLDYRMCVSFPLDVYLNLNKKNKNNVEQTSRVARSHPSSTILEASQSSLRVCMLRSVSSASPTCTTLVLCIAISKVAWGSVLFLDTFF